MMKSTLPAVAAAAMAVGALSLCSATRARSLLTRAALVLTLSAIGAAPAPGQRCQPHWADDLWRAVPPGEVQAMTVFDDGSGPALYMGTAGSWVSNAVARWDGTRLETLGAVMGILGGGAPVSVSAMAVFDDGAGPALYIGGGFTAVNWSPAKGVAKWTGSGWTALGTGMNGAVRALRVYDDGEGPALYAAGAFQQAGGVPASCVAKWDGRVWSALGSGLSGGVYYINPVSYSTAPIGLALQVFDDGTGPALYVGGNFDHAGGAPAPSIARWNGSVWSPVGNGLTWNSGQGAVLTLGVFDGVAGASLYAGGQINFGALNNNPLVARWDGVAWYPVAAWLPGAYVSSLAVADHLNTPSLYAGINAFGQQQGTVFRLDGGKWVAIGDTGPSPVSTLTAFEHGSATRLYAGGNFTTISGVHAPRLAQWDGNQWSALPQGGSVQPVGRLRTLDLGDGSRLYALGSSQIAGQTLPGIGRFDGTGWSAVGPFGQGAEILDVEVYDDGAGKILHAAGHFLGAPRVARLSGGAWEAVGQPMAWVGVDGVKRLRTFDDGMRPKLFAGGGFTGGVRAWDGVTWTTPGGGLPIGSGFGSATLHDLEVFGDGGRARLYAAWHSNLSRWTGAAWELVPCPLSSGAACLDLAVFDDGAGAALYVAQASPTNPVVRYDGWSWTAVAGTTDGVVRALTAFDDSTGPALYATGYFTAIGGASADRIARWRAGVWWPLVGGGLTGSSSSAMTMAVFHLPAPSLWIGGEIVSAGGLPSYNLARRAGCPAPCHADCDQSGTLTLPDFTCFQTKFAAGDPYADCNQSGTLSVADFTCFQSQFVAGCP